MRKEQKLPAIEVEGLYKVYHRLVAVENVSFTTYRGEAFGFLGPNGAGKSTIVKIITGLITQTQGSARVLGQAVNDMEMRRRVGYLPELPNFHRWLKAQEFLEFHGQLYGMRGAALQKRCKEVLAEVGLSGREKQKLGTFSKGMLQRIGLAQALLNQPDLIILDEPVSGLDPVGQHDMRTLLLRLKADGVSIFLNSHQLADVEAVCDRVAIINQGRILKVGTPPELFGNQLLLEVRVNSASEELLQQLKHVAVDVQRDSENPNCLLAEIENDEQAADIADIVHACGARLYSLAPRRRSLEQLFFQTIETFSHS